MFLNSLIESTDKTQDCYFRYENIGEEFTSVIERRKTLRHSFSEARKHCFLKFFRIDNYLYFSVLNYHSTSVRFVARLETDNYINARSRGKLHI